MLQPLFSEGDCHFLWVEFSVNLKVSLIIAGKINDDNDDELILPNGWTMKSVMPYFQPELLLEILTIANIGHTTSRILCFVNLNRNISDIFSWTVIEWSFYYSASNEGSLSQGSFIYFLFFVIESSAVVHPNQRAVIKSTWDIWILIWNLL